jgi:hypothetical protein
MTFNKDMVFGAAITAIGLLLLLYQIYLLAFSPAPPYPAPFTPI